MPWTSPTQTLFNALLRPVLPDHLSDRTPDPSSPHRRRFTAKYRRGEQPLDRGRGLDIVQPWLGQPADRRSGDHLPGLYPGRRNTLMPHFDSNPLEALALQAGQADAELDLRGLDCDTALARVKTLLEQADASAARSYRLRFDPARGDGTETLFQPLGRLLLEARRAGRLTSCLPLPDGGGYFIALAD